MHNNIEKIEFNVAGLFLFSEIIIKTVQVIKDKLDKDIKIKTIYGSPNIKWNGGRLMLEGSINDINTEDIIREFELLKNNNIRPAVTFTNHLLERNDLEDVYCNNLLSILETYNGKVIVASDLLEDYIRKNYKNIEIVSSLIKVEIDGEKGNIEYYKKMEDKYYSYVVHPDDNFNFDLLKLLDKEKCEILLNERCNVNCTLRKQHYESIAREQISVSNGNFIDEKFLNNCTAIPEIKQEQLKNRNLTVSLDEYEAMKKINIKNFKIQGRTNNLYLYFFDFLRYTLDSNIEIALVYPIVCEYIEIFKKNLDGRNK